MDSKSLMTIVSRGLSLLVLLTSTRSMSSAQTAATTTGSIGPMEAYTMDRTAEIALARSAAPASISADAEVMVLGVKGYEVAAKGTNGFVCVVERGWMNDFDDPNFGDTKIRAGLCLNPAGAKAEMARVNQRTALALKRASSAEMKASAISAKTKGELPSAEVGAMCYMMAKDSWLGTDGHWLPHVMFLLPLTKAEEWGANMHGSPIFAFDDTEGGMTIFLLPVGQWSDGSPAPKHDHAAESAATK